MFSDQPKPVKLEEPPKKEKPKAPVTWAELPVDVLIQFYDEIRACLPPVKLEEMNLEEELLLQYHSLRTLQTNVLTDETLPLNQRAQVANSVVSTLDRLVQAQSEVYSQERFKDIENILIRHLKKLPEDVAEAFLLDYKALLLTKK